MVKILREAESGFVIPELCRKHGMSDANFYKWRAKYSGMDVWNMIAIKRTGREKPVPESDICGIQDGLRDSARGNGKKAVRPSLRKEMGC